MIGALLLRGPPGSVELRNPCPQATHGQSSRRYAITSVHLSYLSDLGSIESPVRRWRGRERIAVRRHRVPHGKPSPKWTSSCSYRLPRRHLPPTRVLNRWPSDPPRGRRRYPVQGV